MIEIELKLDQGIPQYSCNSCSNCQSVFGKSMCAVKNRGCCFYFPKFTLYDIQKMVKEKEGIESLRRILSLPNVNINRYYIHAKGYFDEVGYSEYVKTGHANEYNVKDKTIFFRACPFVKEGIGCDLSKKYRSYICNFFICNEVVEAVINHPEYKNYIKERDSYVRWLEWENNSLEQILKINRINLKDNLENALNILKDLPLSEYEYGNLKKIQISNKVLAQV